MTITMTRHAKILQYQDSTKISNVVTPWALSVLSFLQCHPASALPGREERQVAWWVAESPLLSIPVGFCASLLPIVVA